MQISTAPLTMGVPEGLKPVVMSSTMLAPGAPGTTVGGKDLGTSRVQ